MPVLSSARARLENEKRDEFEFRFLLSRELRAEGEQLGDARAWSRGTSDFGSKV